MGLRGHGGILPRASSCNNNRRLAPESVTTSDQGPISGVWQRSYNNRNPRFSVADVVAGNYTGTKNTWRTDPSSVRFHDRHPAGPAHYADASGPQFISTIT